MTKRKIFGLIFGIIATLFLVSPLYVGAEAENFTEGAEETLQSEVLDENVDTEEIVVEVHKDVAYISTLDERKTTQYIAYLTNIQKPTLEDAEMLRSSVNHLMGRYLLTANTEIGSMDVENGTIEFVKQAISSSNYDGGVRTEILNTIANKQVSIEEAWNNVSGTHFKQFTTTAFILGVILIVVVSAIFYVFYSVQR